MPLQSSQSQSDFHWIITSTLFSSWWPWTFLGDREMTRARRLESRLRERSRDQRRSVVCMYVLCPLFSLVQFLVAYALLSEETGMGGTESWHAFVAGANNKTYNFFRFLLSCIVFAAVFPESLQALFMIQLMMALSINSGRSPISRCMLGASLFSKIATSMFLGRGRPR